MYPTPNPSPQIPSGEGVAITHSELVAQGEKNRGYKKYVNPVWPYRIMNKKRKDFFYS